MLRFKSVTTGLVLAMGVQAAGQSSKVDLSAFIGTWKEDQPKSRPFISSALTYTFSQEPDEFVTIERGGVQLRDRVRFDGKDYQTPGVAGRTISWTKVADTAYETRIKREGALIGTGRWFLAQDGKRLTQETTPVRADGQTDTNVIEYVRVSGEGNSLVGVWKPLSTRSAVPDLFVVTPVEDNALKVFYPKNRSSYTIRPDGKEYTPAGQNTLLDMTTSAEALGPRTVRRTTLRAHMPIFEAVMAVSSDGTTLTITIRTPGSPDQPSVFVYEKQP